MPKLRAFVGQTIPGQKMQVLPIGLGVFGGESTRVIIQLKLILSSGLAGITLLVVGYVYYERRKYKKQFRTRKAAEKSLMGQATPMGAVGYGTA